jgi:hypothetical protein
MMDVIIQNGFSQERLELTRYNNTMLSSQAELEALAKLIRA